MSRRLTGASLAVVAALAAALLPQVTRVHATPVCAGPTYAAPPPCPRVFAEPMASTNWTQFGPDTAGRSEYPDGMKALESMYSQYIKLDTLANILHDPNAVSTGIDGIPPWDPHDHHDGLPLYVAEVTDFRVPDKDKAYVVITYVHSAEPCGREAAVRLPEDLALMALGNQSLNNGVGLDGKAPTNIPVTELLKREKIFVLAVSPDGWRSGDVDFANWLAEQSSDSRPKAQSQYGDIRFLYSEENGRGVNTNRQLPTTGWMFRQPAGTYTQAPGQNPILTEPEGIASYKFLTQLKAEHGHIDGVMDIHGPVPFPADIMLPDGEFNPQKEYLLLDMAQRVKHNMDASVGQHIGDPALVSQLRPMLSGLDSAYPLGNVDWTQIGQVWDTINYTVTGAYGFWMAQPGGLDGVGTNYENNCYVVSTGNWNPVLSQFFVDSARAAIYTTLVQSLVQHQETMHIDTRGQVGYVNNPAVLTDATNPSPPPTGFPGNPYFPHFTQTPYSVTSMKFLTDYSRYSNRPFVAVNPSDVAAGTPLQHLDSLVLVNHALPQDATGRNPDPATYYAQLKTYVENGGNLVLTDGAVRALVDMGMLPSAALKYGVGYVGYTDIQDRTDRLVAGLPQRARQTYDPITLGYQLRIERDGHWSGNPESGSANQSPIWMIDRAAWEKLGGHTVGTADPLNVPTAVPDEGKATDKMNVGTLKLGKGQIVVLGALLPDPTDKNPHWFGLGDYGVTFTGHHMFQAAITYSAGDGRSGAPSAVEAAAAGTTGAATLPNTLAARNAGGAAVPLILVGVAGAAVIGRRRRHRPAGR